MTRIRDAPSSFRNLVAPTLSMAADLKRGAATMGDWIMTENTQHDTGRRNSLPETALEEMRKFERREREFRKKDRAERAADLRLPLDQIKVH